MAEIQNVRRAKFRSFPFTSHVRAKCYDAHYITVHRSVYYNIDLCVYYYYYCICVYAWTHTHAPHTSCSVFQLSTCIWRILYTYSIMFWIIHIISAFSLSFSLSLYLTCGACATQRPSSGGLSKARWTVSNLSCRCDDGDEDDKDVNTVVSQCLFVYVCDRLYRSAPN